MKVYFTCSARGEEEFGKFYDQIYFTVENIGCNHVNDYRKDNDAEKIYSSDHSYKVRMFRNHLKFINKTDVVVLEVSTHSLSMGYLMKKALEMGKPVIALYYKGCEPAFALGINDERLQVVEYTKHSLSRLLNSALQYAKDNSDVRFNLTIPPKIAHYLDWISKRKKMPRAVYIRHSLEKMMLENEEYSRNLTLGS